MCQIKQFYDAISYTFTTKLGKSKILVLLPCIVTEITRFNIFIRKFAEIKIEFEVIDVR